MKTLRHLLRFGGIYLVVGALYYGICWTVYHSANHPGWSGIVEMHLLAALVVWCGYGLTKAG